MAKEQHKRDEVKDSAATVKRRVDDVLKRMLDTPPTAKKKAAKAA